MLSVIGLLTKIFEVEFTRPLQISFNGFVFLLCRMFGFHGDNDSGETINLREGTDGDQMAAAVAVAGGEW